ncbi:MAG: UTP--glucose-1-phosphate uridylyltransferase GalU [Gammaproteobacteria bacterium]|tara:strand:+ start:621 stop:1499 length:879 start_codon:yes stop_codon:yes gene_type:complete
MKPVKKAILPVAGLGTRFLPATKAIPKEMLPIIDKPLVQYAVEEAIEIGITEIIFITSHAKKAIERHFLRNIELEKSLLAKSKEEYIDSINPKKFKGIKFTFIDQHDQKGLGHAISLAEPFLDEDDEAVAILLPDDLFIANGKSCLKTLSDLYKETSHSVIAINEVAENKLSNYGVIDASEISGSTFQIHGIIEKPKLKDAPSNMAVCGRYILSRSIFKSLKNIEPGAGGELQLTDAIKDLLDAEKVIASTYKGQKFDCGSKQGFVEATIFLALANKDINKDILKSIQEFIN